MPRDEAPPKEGAERMAEEDDWNARLLGDDQAIERPEVADNLVPSALVGEMAEIGGRSLRSVPAMIVGVNAIPRGIEGGGDPRVTGAVLGKAMGDLHHRVRGIFGEPTPREQGLAIIGAKLEFARRHRRFPHLRRPLATGTRWNLALIREPRQAGGRQGDSPRRIEWDRLGAESHGAVYFHHRRRGFLAWQGFGFGGFGRASAGARLYRATSQARPLSQRRSGHDEPDPAWRGVRHRRRRRDRPRPRPLRALHWPQRQQTGQHYHRAHLSGADRQGAAR